LGYDAVESFLAEDCVAGGGVGWVEEALEECEGVARRPVWLGIVDGTGSTVAWWEGVH